MGRPPAGGGAESSARLGIFAVMSALLGHTSEQWSVAGARGPGSPCPPSKTGVINGNDEWALVTHLGTALHRDHLRQMSPVRYHAPNGGFRLS